MAPAPCATAHEPQPPSSAQLPRYAERERELISICIIITKPESDPNKRTNKSNAEAGKRRKEKGKSQREGGRSQSRRQEGR